MNESFRIWNDKKKEMIYPGEMPEQDAYAIGLNGKVVRIKGEFLTANNNEHLTALFAVGAYDKNKKMAYLGDVFEDKGGKWAIAFDKVTCQITTLNIDTGEARHGLREDFTAQATIIGTVQQDPKLLEIKPKSKIIIP